MISLAGGYTYYRVSGKTGAVSSDGANTVDETNVCVCVWVCVAGL